MGWILKKRRHYETLSISKVVVGGVIYRLGYNDRIKYLCKKIVCENRQGG